MAHLSATETALAEWSANVLPEYGTHTGPETGVAVPGLMIGEIEYDPIKHLPTSINPFSMLEAATGVLQVQEVLPDHPLRVGIVYDASDPAEDPRITCAKTRLKEELRESISQSIPGYSDHLSQFAIVSDAAGRPYDGVTYIQADRDPSVTARSVAAVCLRGLTFIISDFSRLKFGATGAETPVAAVAIKVNHPFDLALPAGVGTLSMGGVEEVNTNKRRELAQKNSELRASQARIAQELGANGLTLAQVIYQPRLVSGIDFIATDDAIAQAVTQLQRL